MAQRSALKGLKGLRDFVKNVYWMLLPCWRSKGGCFRRFGAVGRGRERAEGLLGAVGSSWGFWRFFQRFESWARVEGIGRALSSGILRMPSSSRILNFSRILICSGSNLAIECSSGTLHLELVLGASPICQTERMNFGALCS